MTTLPRSVDVVVIGAGQAGLSMSRCLQGRSIEHIVLERSEVAGSWLSQRWDSFCLVTPNWTVRLAGEDYAGDDPNGFMPGADVYTHLRAYAQRTDAAIFCGVDVVSATTTTRGWRLVTRCGQQVDARAVVVATATHQHPRIPTLASECGEVMQIHASEYRSPAMLSCGAILVVGSGQSGVQIAKELHADGRDVLLATGQVGRVPRRYRGRDVIAWQADLGFLDRHASALESAAARFRPDPQLSGAHGGESLDLREFAASGMRLTGRLRAVHGRTLVFDDDLAANVAFADAFAERFARSVDEWITERRWVAPSGETVISAAPVPVPELRAQLGSGGIETIIWATGFKHDFSWIDAAAVFDEFAYPRQSNGHTAAPGLYFSGLNYVERRRSGILYGAGVDAEQLSAVVVANLRVD